MYNWIQKAFPTVTVYYYIIEKCIEKMEANVALHINYGDTCMQTPFGQETFNDLTMK